MKTAFLFDFTVDSLQAVFVTGNLKPKLLHMAFKEGFTMTLNDLEQLLITKKNREAFKG